MKKAVFTYIILLIFGLKSQGVEIIYNRADQNKLTHLYVADIVKDNMGYMWFATSMGLNRWDGYSYKYFLSDVSNKKSISSNKTTSLYISANNQIWVGTSNGLNLFDPATETFEHFLHQPENDKSIISNNIICLTEDQNGTLWVGTDKGICSLDTTRNEFKKFTNPELEKMLDNNFEVRSMFNDSKGNIWVGFNDGGLLIINTHNQQATIIEYFEYQNETIYLSSVNKTVEQSNGKILVATWSNKIVEFTPRQNDYRIQPWEGNKFLQSSTVEHLTIDKNHDIWIADQHNAIIHYKANEKTANKYTPTSTENPIPTTHLSRLTTIDNNVWGGTYNHGFFIIDYSHKPIQNISPDYIAENTFQVSAIEFVSPHYIVIGTTGDSLYVYNEKNKSFFTVAHKYSLASTVHFDKYNQKLWIGGYSDQLYAFSVIKNTLESEFNYSSFYTPNVIESNDSLVIVGFWGQGLKIFNKNTGRFYNADSTNSKRNFSALDIYVDNMDVWITSINSGLIKYSILKDKFTFYLPKNTKSILPNNQTNIVLRLSNQKLLVSTLELGICYFDEQTETFEPVGIEAGINDLHVKSIVEDNNQNIWIITERDIIKTNNRFNTAISYTIYDGVNYGIEHKAATYSVYSNNLYFAGNKGLQYFKTTELYIDSSSSETVITDFEIFNRAINPTDNIAGGKSISYADQVQLSWKENFISIYFSAMQFNHNASQQYAYRLKGINDEWNIVSANNNSITYSNLTPGTYEFEVKASNKQGIFNTKARSLTIEVLPPFWQTNWFRIIIVLFFIALLILFIKIREINLIKEKVNLEKQVRKRTSQLSKQTKRMQIQNKELKKANQIKNKFFSLISHDLRNPIGSIIQLSDLLDENFDNFGSDQKKELIHAISESTHQTMILLEDLLVWAQPQTNKIKYKIQVNNINKLCREAILSVLIQAKSKKITIENNIPENIEVLADTNTVKTTIRNLLSNAIKFSPTGSSIQIDYRIINNNIEISIKDQGVGIAENRIKKIFDIGEETSTAGTHGEKGTGLGLSLCREFIEKNGGTIRVESTPGKGSIFYFTLPLTY